MESSRKPGWWSEELLHDKWLQSVVTPLPTQTVSDYISINPTRKKEEQFQNLNLGFYGFIITGTGVMKNQPS